ncbi:hypothetical protein [Dankookia rubra]|nr:hypothetical protein [Dankookia rubra]
MARTDTVADLLGEAATHGLATACSSGCVIAIEAGLSRLVC